MNSKKACGKKGYTRFPAEGRNGPKDQKGGYNVKDNIRDVVADGIEAGELIVDGEAYPPERPVGDAFYSRGKTGRDIFYVLNGRIVKNKWDVIKYKLIIKGIEVNS